MTKGGMSFAVAEQPAIMASRPMRTNWCTAELPDRMTLSSRTQCPPMRAPFASTQRSPMTQSWAMWLLTMKKLSLPMTVFMVNSHIAHDCVIGDRCVLANGALIGGHCVLQDNVILSGNSAVHQF